MAKGRRSKHKIDVPWSNFIFCPAPVESAQFQKQFDDVQSMVAEMILIGRGHRLKESDEVIDEKIA